MRQLRLPVREPLSGSVMPVIAAQHGEVEALRRYRAIVLTTLRLLRGLVDTEIRIDADPTDAEEAIRFWLLPQLADHWQADGSGAFCGDGWRIRFTGEDPDLEILAVGHALCPWLSARWVHTAMLGLERGTHSSVGRSPQGEVYFHARAHDAHPPLEEITLPVLPIIHTEADWQQALDSALGASLKRAWQQESG